MTIISGLTASTQYSIEVAAVNNVGTGDYSNVIMQLTQGIVSYTCTILNDLHLIRSLQTSSPVELRCSCVLTNTLLSSQSKLQW